MIVTITLIATSNHFTEPLYVTHTLIHRRAINCRDRVDMTHSFRVRRPARRPSRPCAARWDMTLRSHEGHRSPGLSKWVGPMASTRSPLERASCGSRSTLAADPSGNLASVSPPFFKQVAWGSESRNRALLPHKTTSYQATTSGTAYTDHGKVTFRAREVRASGAAEKRRLVITGDNGVGKGIREGRQGRARVPERSRGSPSDQVDLTEAGVASTRHTSRLAVVCL